MRRHQLATVAGLIGVVFYAVSCRDGYRSELWPGMCARRTVARWSALPLRKRAGTEPVQLTIPVTYRRKLILSNYLAHPAN